MVDLLRRARSSAVRFGLAAQNAVELARFGGLDTGEEPSPFDVAGRTSVYRLRRYFADGVGTGRATRPPVLLVPPLMLSTEVYDVSPAISAVAALHEGGIDPWVVDFGAPENEEGGLQRTLADHVLAVSDAVDRVREMTGRDVHLGGYSQGGMFSYQTAALRRGEGIASLITFGSPVDIHLLRPAGIPVAQLADAAEALADFVLPGMSLPAGLARRAFQLVDPLKTARSRLSFLTRLHDRDALLEREGSRRFLEADGWVAWPGPALAEFASQFIAHNRMLSGGFPIDDRMVTVADIDRPVLAVVGTEDEIAAAASVRAIRRAAPQAEIWELTRQAGHMGLVVGNGARRDTWPVVAQWVHWQEGTAERPEAIAVLTEDHPRVGGSGSGIEVATDIVIGAAKVAADVAVDASRRLRGVVAEAMDQLPRLARLERVDADTRVSMALLLQERADRHPDDTFFLFDGRGHSYAEALGRVDAVTRGLLSLGVRQGEHVGVLMRTRPTALALVTALSRLGAVAVMLRPDGDLAQEVSLAQVSRVVADPEHAQAALSGPGASGTQVLVLGDGASDRRVPDGVIDMERIDPDDVTLPGWYVPNPGRARDLAMVLFTGRGRSARANHITNRRWALSAFGTASAASLGRVDTVYAVTPLHHPATQLTAIGGAIVSGARLAIGTEFTPQTFWDEVRRYGVSVVSYTWTMVAILLRAAPTPAERHHPIRLFMGSGMPTGLWEGVVDRFRPARVLEFYAPTDGEAVLANLTGAKVGAKGRPLPGTADVAVAAYDLVTGRLASTADGFVRRAAVDEPGMLLARVGRDGAGVEGRLLRGVFAKGDSWLSTGDLFRVDSDGDLWLLGRPSSLMWTSHGPIPPYPVQAAMETDDAIALCVVYGVRPGPTDHEVIVAAVTLRRGRSLTDAGLRRALVGLDRESWPSIVHVRDEMPTSTHHRIQTRRIRAEGLPVSGPGLRLDTETGTYMPLES